MFTLDADVLDFFNVRKKGQYIGDPNKERLKGIIANLQRVGFFPFQAATEYEVFEFRDINDYQPDIVSIEFEEQLSTPIFVEFKDAT